jgi:TolB protein
VDVKRSTGGALVVSETVSGANAHEALLRAADIAVTKTNAMGLRGYFTARLAFVGEGTGVKEIYLSDLFMQDMKRATNDRAQVLKPRWAPDGSRLLFTSYLAGVPDIYSYDLRSFQRTKFVGYKGTNMGAQFSPNGAQVAMILTGEGSSEIYVRSAASGAQPRRLTRSEQVKSSPCWSPDGSRLVFAMDPGPQLYVMSAGGGAPARLGSGFSYMAEPDWSRATNKIACTVRVAGGRYQIAVIEAGGGQAKVVSNADFDAIEPAWLADGRHLVYTARDRRSSVLCILDTETGRSTALPTSWPAMQASVWTPR